MSGAGSQACRLYDFLLLWGGGRRENHPFPPPHTPVGTIPLVQHHKHSLHEGSECLFLWMYLEPLTSNEIFHFPLLFLSGGNASHQNNRVLGKQAPKSNLHSCTPSSPSPLPQGTCRRVALANSPALCPVLLLSTSERVFLPFPMGDLVPVYHLWHLQQEDWGRWESWAGKWGWPTCMERLTRRVEKIQMTEYLGGVWGAIKQYWWVVLEGHSIPVATGHLFAEQFLSCPVTDGSPPLRRGTNVREMWL